MEGLPALMLWDLVIEVFAPACQKKIHLHPTVPAERNLLQDESLNLFGTVDYVPPSLPITNGRAKLFIMEDNDAVIKMIIKERSPPLRHVARTHRVGLDWLFERINRDRGVFIKFVGTKEQAADFLTKGSFTADAWDKLCKLCQTFPVGNFRNNSRSKLSVANKCNLHSAVGLENTKLFLSSCRALARPSE
jgi:hypothetical protein